MKQIVIPIVIICLFSCTKEEVLLETEQKVQVNIHKVELQEITPDLNSFGSISFRSKADVTSAVDGTISRIRVEEGDYVYKGTELAILSNIQLQIREEQTLSSIKSSEAALELSETKLLEGKLQIEARLLSIEKSELNLLQKEKEQEQLAKTLENKKELFNIGGITEEELTSMELNYSASETNLMSLKKDISIQKVGFRDSDIQAYGYDIPDTEEKRIEILKNINTRTLLAEVNVAKSRVESAMTEFHSAQALNMELSVKAPISGIIGAKYMELGERAKADTKIFTIFDSSEVDISFPVPESKGILLNAGLPVEATVDSLENRIFTANIRQISPMVDPQSGNITVKASMQNEDEIFRPGMFTRVRIKYGETRKTILIPETCIAQKKNKTAVLFLIVNSRIFRKDVELGEEKNGMVEILVGLKKGDLVIDSPSPLLREGEQVDIKENDK